MELKNKLSKVIPLLKKYRFVVLVLVIGLILMTFPMTEEKIPEESIAPSRISEDMPSIEERLTQVLRTVEGIGDIQIVLTVAEGEEIVYQTDISNSQTDTVTVTDSSREEKGLIRQINPNKYLGAIVVCQGGDNPTVRLAVVDAVSKATGLGANQISVLKMK